jgi:hypothetical protein
VITPPKPEDCGVLELRQYTLKPGRRDDLVNVFEREFVEGQEVDGMCILGTFRDLDRDDRFVWVRGFRDMDERLQALTAFYSGAVWKANSAEANDTMIDVDDVLLLRPLTPVSFPEPSGDPRAVRATIAHVRDGDVRDLVADGLIAAATTADWLATFVTLRAENTFRALPIREDADVVVVLTAGGAVDAGDEQLRLEPTARSRVR